MSTDFSRLVEKQNCGKSTVGCRSKQFKTFSTFQPARPLTDRLSKCLWPVGDFNTSEGEVNSLEAMAGGLGLEAKFKAPLESILIGDSFLIWVRWEEGDVRLVEGVMEIWGGAKRGRADKGGCGPSLLGDLRGFLFNLADDSCNSLNLACHSRA